MPDESLLPTPALPEREQVHVGYIATPKLDRLMELRDALVALNGPLANDPRVRESLHRQLLSEENRNRILGKVCHSPPLAV